MSDSANNTIRRVDVEGNVTTVAGVAGVAGEQDGPVSSATFDFPNGIAVGADGTIYVVDTTSGTIRAISDGGFVSTVAGHAYVQGSDNGLGTNATFDQPFGMVIDSSGNLYVADSQNHVIRRIKPDGIVGVFAGSPSHSGHVDGAGSAAQLSYPIGIAIDEANNLYVSDPGDETIRKVDPEQNVSTIAGVVFAVGHGDGPALSARFNFPACLAVDTQGNVYIGDANNYTVRELDTTGTVSTLAGVAGTDEVETGPLPGLLSNVYGISVSPSGDLFPLSAHQVFVIR